MLAILHNRFYLGEELYQATYMDETYRQVKNEGQMDRYLNEQGHPPLIDPESFERAAEMIDRRREKGLDSGRRTVFSGKLLCGCGGRMVRTGREEPGYVCTAHRSGQCTAGPVCQQDIMNAFATMLNKLAFAEEKGRSVLEAYGARMQAYRDRLRDMETEMEAIRRRKEAMTYRGMLEGYTTQVRRELVTLEAETDELLREKEQVEQHMLDGTESLRSYVRRRGIYPAFEPSGFENFVESAVIRDACFLEVRFTCGLELTECLQATR